MILVALTDIHGNVKGISRVGDALREADLVLLPGDLTRFGREEAAEEVIGAVRQYNERILAVPGNCDHIEVTQYLQREGLCLHNEVREINGFAFMGLGGSLPCPAHTPTEYREEEITAQLNAMRSKLPPDLPVVLVCHQPPWGTMNDAVGEQHVGSTAVRAFIEDLQPLICFTGHIHEGVAADRVGRTSVVNPGPFLAGAYAYVRLKPDEVEMVALRKV